MFIMIMIYDLPSDEDESNTENGQPDGERNDKNNCHWESCNIIHTSSSVSLGDCKRTISSFTHICKTT